MQSQDVMTATVVAILALADRSKWRRLELAVLAALAAVESLVKLNQGAEWIGVFIQQQVQNGFFEDLMNFWHCTDSYSWHFKRI